MLVWLFLLKMALRFGVLFVFYRKIAQKSIKFLLIIGKNVTYSTSKIKLFHKSLRRRFPVRLNIYWEPE